MKRKSQINPDTIARIINADKQIGRSVAILKQAKNVGQELADLEWARVLIERAVNGLKQLRN